MHSKALHNRLIKFAVCAAVSFAALFIYEYFMWSGEPIPPERDSPSRSFLVQIAVEATFDQWLMVVAGAIAIYALSGLVWRKFCAERAK